MFLITKFYKFGKYYNESKICELGDNNCMKHKMYSVDREQLVVRYFSK